jgi:hypothetical protein
VEKVDIRAWRTAHGLSERLDDPEVIERVTRLLGRELTPDRIAHYAAQSQQKPDQSERRTLGEPEDTDAQPA